MQKRDSDYYLNERNEFVIKNYNSLTPFSSFLPAISGLYGKPMWVFYVNRGQCIAAAGINNKDYSIIEFLPANKAYRQTSLNCFRTFLKVSDGKNKFFYEPFQNNLHFNRAYNISQKMYITSYDLRLEDINHTLGLKTEVMYCTLPGESLSSLVRSICITNISNKPLGVELLDGLPVIIPYYLTNYNLKNESNLRQAWMGVENYKTLPFFKIKVLPYDTPEIIYVRGGNFFLNFSFNNNRTIFSKAIIEPGVVFGNITDFMYPENFISEKFHVPSGQVNSGITPCGFGYKKIKLEKNSSDTTYTLLGNSDKYEKLVTFADETLNKKYIINKINENKELIESLKSPVFCSGSNREFNLYCGQTFLDNLLRGGYPVRLGNDRHVFYVYSRKHGDLEREYNFFQVDSTNFSQGNSNFRDVCQNRRNDVFFFPFTDDTNIKLFLNFIQLDGFNPLALKGSEFRIMDKEAFEKIINKYIHKDYIKSMKNFFTSAFTPGSLLNFIESNEICPVKKEKLKEFLNEILSISNKENIAEFQEGYWVDHWTYINDLIEQYISVFPDKIVDLLLNRNEFTYFDSSVFVKPENRKYILTGNGVRQLGAITRIPEKEKIINKRPEDSSKVHTNTGRGSVYRCSMLSKLICIITNKIASLDPEGTGIEMEADKPGWCDALNGLPGLIGSSINESAEVKRLALILLDIFKIYRINSSRIIKLPGEIFSFFRKIESLLNKKISGYEYWDISHRAKEDFRRNTIFGISGKEEKIDMGTLKAFLNNVIVKIDSGLEKAYNNQSGVYYTYFINEVVDYEIITDDNKNPLKNEEGYPYVKPLKFKQRPIPYFLEGPVHILRVEKDIKKAKKLYLSIRNTGLYDNRLGMYLVNDYIMDETKEIGRQNIFPRGWLENESVFLHMEYKYLLELLKCGLYDEFFKDIKNALVPFLNPAIYGRSILENSTFIVSTAHIDSKIHGKGYVSRLTGTAAEFLSMWLLMTAGSRPFYPDSDGKLCLEFRPVLPGWFFTEKSQKISFYEDMKKKTISLPANTFAFHFLGRILTIYHNGKRKNTWGNTKASIKKIILYRHGKKVTDINDSKIFMPYSQQIRDGIIDRIDVFMQ